MHLVRAAVEGPCCDALVAEGDATWMCAVGHRGEEAWAWTGAAVEMSIRVEAVAETRTQVEIADAAVGACIQVEAAADVVEAVDDRYHMLEAAVAVERAGTVHDSTGHREDAS